MDAGRELAGLGGGRAYLDRFWASIWRPSRRPPRRKTAKSQSEQANAPVRKTILVEASQERAFQAFTAGLDTWWPRPHKLGPADLERAVMEPHTGGRWYEIGKDGSECGWGKVLAWEPSSRLVLAWQISPQWQFDPSILTEVEVRFIAEGERRTRVELEHRHLDRLGDAAGAMREAFESPGGWSGILAGYKKAAETAR